jgi:hypothetical protein
LPLELASLDDAAAAPLTPSASESTSPSEDAVGLLPESTAILVKPATKQSSQLDSPLLSKLPRELRDKIYREAVLEDLEIPIQVASYKSKDGEHRCRLELEHALLLVCKQTRQEVADIYYLENVFRVTNDLFEIRAIRKLHQALCPWADKMKKLEISHEFAGKPFSTVEIDLSVSASQGRIVIEPLYHNIRDGYQSMRDFRLSTTKMCYCKTLGIAAEHGEGNVLNWAQRYVDMILKYETRPRPINVYCWNCAGINIF